MNFCLSLVKSLDETSISIPCLWYLASFFDVIADDYNISSPMKKVVVPNYQSKSGTAFTYEEEKKLVNHCLANLKKDTSHVISRLLCRNSFNVEPFFGILAKCLFVLIAFLALRASVIVIQFFLRQSNRLITNTYDC